MDQFHDIYERCAEKVYRFLLGLTQSADQAEELTAETFYQAFLHIDRFRGDCAIETWLCQIAKNAFYKEQKRRKRFHPEPEHLAERGEPDGALQRLEDRQAISRSALYAVLFGRYGYDALYDPLGQLRWAAPGVCLGCDFAAE